MKNKKINGVINIPTSLNTDFFKLWLEFLGPFHNLRPKEIEILAAFLKERHRLSKVIADDEVLNSVLMSSSTKTKIREECGITNSHLKVVFTKFKKTNIIKEGKLNSKFIPKNIGTEDSSFELLLHFDFDG